MVDVERVTPELRDSIKDVVQQPPAAYSVSRLSWFAAFATLAGTRPCCVFTRKVRWV